MPDFDLILSGRQVRNRKPSIVISQGIIRVVHDDNITLHPSVDGALDVDCVCLLEFLLVHLSLNRLCDVEEAVLTLKKLNVVQYRVTVAQGDLAVHGHDLNMGCVLTLLLIYFRILSSGRHCSTAFHTLHNHHRVLEPASSVDDQLLRFSVGLTAHLWILANLSHR